MWLNLKFFINVASMNITVRYSLLEEAISTNNSCTILQLNILNKMWELSFKHEKLVQLHSKSPES